MNKLEQIIQPIKKQLEQIEQYSQEKFKQDYKLIAKIEQYSFQSGGKRIRPIILLLTALHFGENNDNIKKLAVILEYIHTASLMHDDVVDESLLRRNKTTANNIWGNKSVVLVGDYLFAKSFKQMTEINNLEIAKLFATTVELLSEGEILQLSHSFDNCSVKKYFEIIQRKTACLFASAMQSGAIITEQPIKIKKNIYKCGEYLGMAFQIIDDILDYLGKKSGKAIGTDLREKKITLPLCQLFNVLDAKKKKELIQLLQQKDNNQIQLATTIELMKSNQIFDNCFAIAEDYIQKAKKILTTLSVTTYSEKLIKLADFIIKREY